MDLNPDDFDEEELLLQNRKTKPRKMREIYDREDIYHKPDDHYDDR